MVFGRAARVRKEGVGRGFGSMDFGRAQTHRDDGRLKFDAPQALFQESHEMLFVPGGLGERQVDGGRLDRLTSAFVFECHARVRERELLRTQPAAKLDHETTGREKNRFGMFDPVRQFDPGAECGRHVQPLVQLRR
jgi:hypothetical protein